MGMFRSKGGSEEAASITSGQPYEPDLTAVTEVVTSPSFGITWQIDPTAPRSVAPEDSQEAGVTADTEELPSDEVAESLRAWLRERTQR
ncbi:hypothetical protein [Mumia quercus]|uniref:hypothetical protein n=1 Tax=Mumia quercus TaxID=2976125 RepID=UPI0021D2690A|nr:hypothetical protein [Mumia quercus]